MIDEVKHTRNGGRSAVKVNFTVTCAGNPVTTKYEARTKITHFSEEKLHEATPDSAGSATITRVEQADPSDEKIT